VYLMAGNRSNEETIKDKEKSLFILFQYALIPDTMSR